MSIAVNEITLFQKNKILNSEESHFLDLKSIDIKPSKLTKTISAFANANGGDIYIGIDEINTVDNRKLRKWRGFKDQEAANSHIRTFEEFFPLGEYYSYSFLNTSDCEGLVLQVSINKSREIATASDKKIYIRRGAQSLPVKQDEEITRLKLDKGIVSFETETINIELSLILESVSINKFIKNVIPTSQPYTWLKKQLLIRYEKPTVSGVLLFSDEPQAILPKRCGVKIYRYKTIENEGTRDTLAFNPITIEGCLYNQIKRAVEKTIKVVEEIPKMGKQGLESIKYPQETIHEIITNAILHRDYSIVTDIQVRIFDNRIEVESPGKLPGHITVKNILQEQFARNGQIIRIINKFPNPPNKDVGEGLNTAFQAMAKLRLKPPKIKENSNSVTVFIKHEHLASIESEILEYLDNHEEITNKIARKITGIKSESTIVSAFNKLRNKNIIELIPGRSLSSSAWRKTGLGNHIETEYKPDFSELYPIYKAKILNYLEKNKEITNKHARQIVGIKTSRTMNYVLSKLRKEGLIDLVPNRSRRKSTWRKI